MVVCLVVGGFMGLKISSHPGLGWGVGAMLLVYTFIYDLTVGPVCYSLVTELSSTRLKNKTVVLARNLYNVSGIVANVLITRQLNPSAWNWGTNASFFWAGIAAIMTVWSYFRLPEPKGRTYAEIDMLFEAKVSARKFKSTKVGTFVAEVVGDLKPAGQEKMNVWRMEQVEKSE